MMISHIHLFSFVPINFNFLLLTNGNMFLPSFVRAAVINLEIKHFNKELRTLSLVYEITSCKLKFSVFQKSFRKIYGIARYSITLNSDYIQNLYFEL